MSTEKQREKWRLSFRERYKKHYEHIKARRRLAYSRNRDKYSRATRVANNKDREFIRSLKTAPCMDCKISYPPCVMDFDHRPDEEKLGDIWAIYQVSRSKEEVLREAAKCDLVCSNCHRLRTEARRVLKRQQSVLPTPIVPRKYQVRV